MAEIQVTFPESISESQMRSVVLQWEKSLEGYKIRAGRSAEYQAVEMLAFTENAFNPGFLAALSKPLENELQTAEFQINLQSENSERTYSGGVWQ